MIQAAAAKLNKQHDVRKSRPVNVPFPFRFHMQVPHHKAKPHFERLFARTGRPGLAGIFLTAKGLIGIIPRYSCKQLAGNLFS
jgi:hypothetical protein